VHVQPGWHGLVDGGQELAEFDGAVAAVGLACTDTGRGRL